MTLLRCIEKRLPRFQEPEVTLNPPAAPGIPCACLYASLFQGYPALMEQLPGPQRELGDEQLAEAAPRVRALVLERLEMIWSQVQPHVDGSIIREDGRVDVRFLEAGIRVLDRLSRLYRLDQPAASTAQENVYVDARALVEAQLAEIAARQDPGT